LSEHRNSNVQRRELFGWAMFDFANSGYTTVVLTALFNAYFVGVIAGNLEGGSATFLWTITIAAANAIVLFSAPVVGAIADQHASKKKMLLYTTIGCAGATMLLAFPQPGDIAMAMLLVLIATVMFSSGENLIAAFLPEISTPEHMGRISGYGWSLGYLGGIFTLGLCLSYLQWSTANGGEQADAIPAAMLITGVVFALAAIPTFVWLRERATPAPIADSRHVVRSAFRALARTVSEASHFRDLLRLLIAIAVYQSGVITVIVLAAVYAQEVMGFDTEQLLMLILVVNVTSAVGAFLFGFFQDTIGSRSALLLSLSIWIVAVILALLADKPSDLWIVGNLVGLAMGASQSIGRALVGQFTPVARSGEFFGLWGLSQRLAAILGPLSYGAVNYLSGGDHRTAMFSTLLFLIGGMLLVLTVNEERGRSAARHPPAEILERV